MLVKIFNDYKHLNKIYEMNLYACLLWKVSTMLYLYSTTQCVLQSYCRVQMESMALVQHVSPLPGSGLSVTADLNWRQQNPLNPKRHHDFYNHSIIPPTAAFSLSNVLRQYALRNSMYFLDFT